MTRLRLTASSFLTAAFAASFLLEACNSSQEQVVAKETVINVSEARDPSIHTDLLSLMSDTVGVPTDLPSSEHLFGKFFNDRAEFFIIENPSNTLYQSGIQSITLFHLDGRLQQTKYVVEENIESKLLQHLGPCKIIPLDSVSKVVAATQKIVKSENSQLVMNPTLTHYELKWEEDDTLVRYRVQKNRKKEMYVYIESSKEYAQEMKEIERAAIF